MAVVKATIKAAILSLENDAQASEMTKNAYADRLADIIRNAILSASVTGTATGVTTGGSSVPVTGSLT